MAGMTYSGSAGNAAVGDYTVTSSWSAWNVDWSYYSTGTATTTADYTWGGWNGGTGTSITTDTVWYQWSNGFVEPVEIPEAQRLTREQVEAKAAEIRAEAERLRKEAEEADARAEELLKQHLDEPQAAEYNKDKTFTVISKDGQRKYKIQKGWSHNVVRIDDNGRPVQSFCAHPSWSVPEHDNMLAQKLMLETAEEAFLAIANKRQIA